jgi:proteasome assembly chaperone (PAC2) family protein
VRLKFGAASKKLRLTTATAKDSHPVLIQKLPGEGSLGTGLAKHLILEISKFLAPLLV